MLAPASGFGALALFRLIVLANDIDANNVVAALEVARSMGFGNVVSKVDLQNVSFGALRWHESSCLAHNRETAGAVFARALHGESCITTACFTDRA
jgi:hypothetical protein